MSTFEDRLLDQLRLVVEQNPAPAPARPRVRRRRLALSGAVAAAVAAASAVALTSGGDAAYAVSQRADGAVTVSIASLSDAAGLQAKLRAAGIPADVTYLDHAPACEPIAVSGLHIHTVRGAEHARMHGPVTEAAPGAPGPGRAAMMGTVQRGGRATFTLDPGAIPAGQRVHITASGGKLSTLSMGIGGSGKLPPPPCP